jgi:hypothetical protein
MGGNVGTDDDDDDADGPPPLAFDDSTNYGLPESIGLILFLAPCSRSS